MSNRSLPVRAAMIESPTPVSLCTAILRAHLMKLDAAAGAPVVAGMSAFAQHCQVAVLVFLLSIVAGPGSGVARAGEGTEPLKLIELFTSHGCSSCPAADRLLGTLLEDDPDLMALEFHVDYWNSLVHGNDGSFTDPFSKYDYSMRQREYNEAGLGGRPGVYTPQAVINGVSAAVGSNKRNILRALSAARAPELSISIEPAAMGSDRLSISIDGDAEQRQSLKGTDITLVQYIDKASTAITGGENRNLVLENHHIVFQTTRLGEIDTGSPQRFEVDAPDAGHGCVVMVQEDALTRVFAAAECP